MRVLHVMAGAKHGSAETSMVSAVLALAEAGVEQQVIIRAEDEERLSILENAGVPVALASFDKVWRGSTMTQINRALKEMRPDVVHCWMGRAGAFAPKSTSARNLGWYGGPYNPSRFRHCRWHVGVTPQIARHIVAQGVPEDQVGVLPAFAAIETAPPTPRASLATPDDAPVVLSFARPGRRAGAQTLLSALSELPGVYLWAAGEAPLESELRAEAHALGVLDRVRFLPNRKDHASLLAACDLVALPERPERFGTITLQAWAAGRPILVSDAIGPASVVTPGCTALTVPRNDGPALREGLRRLLEDADFAHGLVENGRRAYQTHYTKPAFVRSAMTLYERVRARAEHAAAA